MELFEIVSIIVIGLFVISLFFSPVPWLFGAGAGVVYTFVLFVQEPIHLWAFTCVGFYLVCQAALIRIRENDIIEAARHRAAVAQPLPEEV